MSHTTETLHVRGITRARFLDAIRTRMKEHGWSEVVGAKPELEPELATDDENERRLHVRRDGRSFTLVDAAGYDQRGDEPADADLQAWGEQLSRMLDRSVLTISTWDGEASVTATRWKRGGTRGTLELLGEAYRGADGRPYASAKIFWPWLPRDRRDTILAQGIKLVTPGGEPTGDPELDALLEGFEDAEDDEPEPEAEDPESVFVDESVSVAALAAAVGMKHPRLDPWDPDERDEQLLFRRTA